MKLTALPYAGNTSYSNELRKWLARAVTYIEVYGVNADTSNHTQKLIALFSAAAAGASKAKRRAAPAPLAAWSKVGQPRTVVIDFGCYLAVPAATAASAFTVNGTSAVTCQIVGQYVVLSTSADVGATSAVVYTKPGSNPLVDSSGNQVASFSTTCVRE